MLTRLKVNDQGLKPLNEEVPFLAAIRGKNALLGHTKSSIFIWKIVVSKFSLKFRIYELGYK